MGHVPSMELLNKKAPSDRSDETETVQGRLTGSTQVAPAEDSAYASRYHEGTPCGGGGWRWSPVESTIASPLCVGPCGTYPLLVSVPPPLARNTTHAHTHPYDHGTGPRATPLV